MTDVRRWSYGTVSIVALLAVYSWSPDESYLSAYAIILGTALALAIAHLYSHWLTESVASGRVGGARWWELIKGEATFLVITIPSFAVLVAAAMLDVDLPRALEVAEGVSLGCLSVIAMLSAHKSGLGFWQTLEAGSIGLLLGLLVIALQVGLKPH